MSKIDVAEFFLCPPGKVLTKCVRWASLRYIERTWVGRTLPSRGGEKLQNHQTFGSETMTEFQIRNGLIECLKPYHCISGTCYHSSCKFKL
mmetsp:Transcript_3295/g.6094  ORF Transcript_3295/g.6094 Transcript_3295/m.6094 type:complete len:91 (-) Transcript_3295:72-344(-)